MSASIINHIAEAINRLPTSERRVASFVLDHQSTVSGMAQADLARSCEVSTATVSRFCRRFDTKSYHDFQIQLADSMSQAHGGPSLVDEVGIGGPISADDVHGSLRNLLANKIAGLETTLNDIDEDELLEVVRAIAQAGILEVAGTGRTIPIAEDVAYQYERLGIPCSTSQYYEKLLSTAICLKRGDVLLVICRSGWTGVLQQVMRAAKEHGALTALVTANADSPLARMADHVFVSTSLDGIADGPAGNSRMSDYFILEAIYLLLISVKSDALLYLSEHERYVVSNVETP